MRDGREAESREEVGERGRERGERGQEREERGEEGQRDRVREGGKKEARWIERSVRSGRNRIGPDEE